MVNCFVIFIPPTEGQIFGAQCPVWVWMIHDSFGGVGDRKSTRLNSSHSQISYAVFCLKKKNGLTDFSPFSYFRVDAQVAVAESCIDLNPVFFCDPFQNRRIFVLAIPKQSESAEPSTLQS